MQCVIDGFHLLDLVVRNVGCKRWGVNSARSEYWVDPCIVILMV